jgi:hypothetical protein
MEIRVINCDNITALLFAVILYHRLQYLLTQLFTYLLTYSMEQSLSSEANRLAATQEIPCSL